MVAVPGSLVSWVHNGWRPASPTPIVGRLSWRSPQPPRRVARRPGQAAPATGLYYEVWRAWARRRALPSPQRRAAVRSTLSIRRRRGRDRGRGFGRGLGRGPVPWPWPLRGSFSWPLLRALVRLALRGFRYLSSIYLAASMASLPPSGMSVLEGLWMPSAVECWSATLLERSVHAIDELYP